MKKTNPFPEGQNETHEVKVSEFDNRNSGDILKELKIPERTQKPPTAELIARLNEIASKPPFSYLHKSKENDTR